MTTNSFIPQDEITIVKTISFSITIGDLPHFAKIIYTRKPPSEYKMKQDDTSLKRLYYENKEEAYPNDEIDEFILEGIKKIYTDAIFRNSILLFNTRLDEYKQTLSKICKNEFRIHVNPYNDIDKAIKSGIIEWKAFFIRLQLFCTLSDKEIFQDSFSIIEYDVADRKIKFDDFRQKLKNNIGSIFI